MADLGAAFDAMLESIVTAIPAIIAAIIILAIGYVIGIFAGKAANIIVEKLGIERSLDRSSVGKSFRASGIDISNLTGSIVKAFVIILALILAIDVLNIQGAMGDILSSIAGYLPRLLAGILIIIFGAVLVDFLATFIGTMIRPLFSPQKQELAEMLRNLIFIGLIAFILLLALDTMLLSGSLIYPLILGFVIIGAGVSLTDALIKSIIDDHGDFREVAGFAKFVLYAVFLIIGTGAIFATFPGVTGIIGTISWAFAIALAIMLIPLTYSLVKKMAR